MFRISNIKDYINDRINNSNFVTEEEVNTIINNRIFQMILSSDTIVPSKDNGWYLNNANGMSVIDGSIYWDGNVYVIPVDGNYQVSTTIRYANLSGEFQCYIQILNDLGEVKNKYIVDWSNNGYTRNSTIVLPKTIKDDKIRVGIYNAGTTGEYIIGSSADDRIYIDFESYSIGPISDSSTSTIQGNWSGGAQTYFQNDTTDDETIVNTLSVAPYSQSWFT